MTTRRVASLFALVLMALCVAACGGGSSNAKKVSTPTPDPSQAPRSFLMGLSSQPADMGGDAYREAFKLASQAGEVVMIQRAPAWGDFEPGASISDRTERLTRFEKDLAKQNSLKLFLAIDPTEPGDRGRIANLPDDLRGKDFSDPKLRAAFIAYAKYMALNYKPTYMALGVEVDMIYDRRGDGAFRNFLSLYFEAYDAVKSVSSSTLVFPTFEYENIQGKLSTNENTQPLWPLIAKFEPKLDMLAMSSFPGLVYKTPDEIPNDYYMALKGRSTHPLAITSIGWSSDTAAGGTEGQLAYMTRALAAADTLKATLLVWYLGRDIKGPGNQTVQPLLTMGVYDAEDQPKSSWTLWLKHRTRPQTTE